MRLFIFLTDKRKIKAPPAYPPSPLAHTKCDTIYIPHTSMGLHYRPGVRIVGHRSFCRKARRMGLSPDFSPVQYPNMKRVDRNRCGAVRKRLFSEINNEHDAGEFHGGELDVVYTPVFKSPRWHLEISAYEILQVCNCTYVPNTCYTGIQFMLVVLR